MATSLNEVLGPKAVELVARETGFLRRKRELLPYILVLAIVATLGIGKAEWIADILRAYNKLAGDNFAYKPFHNRLVKWTFGRWMRRLLEVALTKLAIQVLAAVPGHKLERFDDILIHDGTSFAIKASLKKVFPGRFKKNAPAAVELHVTMSGLKNGPKAIRLAPDKEAETHFRPDPATVTRCLLLGDRAFQDQRYFAALQLAKGFFIIRGTKNIKPRILRAYDARGRRVRKLEGKTLSHRLLPRYSVDLDISWGPWAGRLAILYVPGRGRKKVYTYLHTNLDRADFTMDDVGHLYRLRWQVELMNKDWKSYANLHKFHTGKKAIAEGLIWGSILASVVKRYITHATELITRVELSTQRAASSALHYLHDIVRALTLPSMETLETLVCAITSAMAFLTTNAKRAHPKRDRIKGRLRFGLRPAAEVLA
jgi:hypothetical protein